MQSILAAARVLSKPAKELVGAIDFVVNTEKWECRKVTMAHRYLVDKVQMNFLNVGFPKVYSRRLAMFMHNFEEPDAAPPIEMCTTLVKTAPDAFNLAQAYMFGSLPAAAETTIASQIHAMMEKCNAVVEKKSAHVLKTMTRKGWKNAMVLCEWPLPEKFDLGIGDEDKYIADPGSSPWVVGVSGNSWRHGPADIPLPGLPQILVTLDCQIVVSLFSAAPLLAQGLMPADIKAYLNSASGDEYAKEHPAVSVVGPQSALYILVGLIPVATHITSSKKDALPRPTHLLL